ncbi:DUF2470 domain-containing protein [Kitasatospora sp. NPDC089509]|uniref:DUF2470 domain-containing protein n=1 Tax=Kitasatospora sp. NPDC089509 TaxID=3364079 RepID=UPI0037FA06FC
MTVPVSPARPSTAETTCTILSTATSAALTTAGRPAHPVRLVSVGHTGHLVLDSPPDAALAHSLGAAPRQRLAAVVDITDLAANPVRERVRARLALRGRITLISGRLLGFAPATATLQQGSRTRPVELDDLARAEPDPLAAREAELLLHLADHHADLVDALTRRLGARELLGVVRVLPLCLDRHGIVLRLERARDHQDVRLPFRTTLDDPRDTGKRLQELLVRTRAGHYHRA